jgi:hypothetical protein
VKFGDVTQACTASIVRMEVYAGKANKQVPSGVNYWDELGHVSVQWGVPVITETTIQNPEHEMFLIKRTRVNAK